jgi:DNA (cytosine-5)-methyltransferase 1
MDYHNEIDPYCAQWLRNLMGAGHIPQGFVDERDIKDVRPMDLWGYDRCHFFSGIGGWAYALRLAGVSDDVPLWTGSCPCQPFSAAGKGGGFADERHLWPSWHYLVEQRRPPVILGEQVASVDGYAWLDLVQSDLEGLDYACGATVLPAASVQAPHERHRIWFVADSNSGRWASRQSSVATLGSRNSAGASGSESRDISDANGAGLAQREEDAGRKREADGAGERLHASASGHLSDTNGESLEWSTDPRRQRRHWAAEPSVGRVADGVPDRVDKLRALGNSIVPQTAATFIKAYFEARL